MSRWTHFVLITAPLVTMFWAARRGGMESGKRQKRSAGKILCRIVAVIKQHDSVPNSKSDKIYARDSRFAPLDDGAEWQHFGAPTASGLEDKTGRCPLVGIQYVNHANGRWYKCGSDLQWVDLPRMPFMQ